MRITKRGFCSRPVSAGPNNMGFRIFFLRDPPKRYTPGSVDYTREGCRRGGEGGEGGGQGRGGETYESAPPKGVWYLYSIPFNNAIASCSFLTAV